MGFVFIGVMGLHVSNNISPLIGYLSGVTVWIATLATAALTVLFWFQPAPIKTVLGWSGNIGPAMERFEMADDGMVFDYSPSLKYKMRLTVKTGPAYHAASPPVVAIWLENQGGYHIKTLLAPDAATDANATRQLPYWSFKRAGWEKAKRDAETMPKPDAVTMPTPNGSFDPADYILPNASQDATRYQLLLEINQPDAHRPSLVYSVEIDNSLPRVFQLELRGYPKREGNSEDGKEVWALFYIDESFTAALDLIDSALLTIQREK